MRRILILLMLMIIALPLLLNAALYYLDPLGAATYFHDLRALTVLSEPHESGIRYLPGRYDFRGYTATIGSHGLRIVPDTVFSDCTIATVGDSVTFGMGVEDYETFTNLLAKTFNTVQWFNAGIPGYSALNISRQMEAVEADAYLWLIVSNDDEPLVHYFGGRLTPSSNAILQYLTFLRRQAPGEPNIARFDNGAQMVLSHANVIAFVFDGVRLTDHIAETYPQVIIIPVYTETVSRADPHPNAAGHRQIADAMSAAMTPAHERAMQGFIDRACNA